VYIIILGAPGSGKGTQGQLITQSFGIPAISTGDLLREVTKNSLDPLAKEIAAKLDQGLLVTNDLIIKVLQKRLNQGDCAKGFILDGFPRSLEQAKLINQICNLEETFIINLEVKLELLIERLTGRFSCNDCNSLYNKFLSPTHKEGICDNCGSHNFTSRSDDEASIIEKRIKVYQEETIPVIQYYSDLIKEKLVKMKTFDGTMKPDELFKEINSFILSWQK
jgi:adenylate kinase